MNKKWKTRWIKALTSKKYEQGRMSLKEKTDKGYAYCCLGVLRDLINPRSNAMQKNESKQDVNYLCHAHLKVAGLDDSTQRVLGKFNDNQRWGFPRIAKWVDKHL